MFYVHSAATIMTVAAPRAAAACALHALKKFALMLIDYDAIVEKRAMYY